MPQFGMLSHVSSLRLSSGHSGPVLTLSTDYAAHVPVFSPCSLVVDGSLCWQLQLGTCSVGFFSSRLCCPLRFQNSPQALLWEGFLLFGNFSFMTPFPEWVSIPNSFVSFFLSFIFCPTSYLFLREWAAFLGAWCSPPACRNYFVEVVQHSNDLLMNLWGTKWSPCPIPLPSWDWRLCGILMFTFIIGIGL